MMMHYSPGIVFPGTPALPTINTAMLSSAASSLLAGLLQMKIYGPREFEALTAGREGQDDEVIATVLITAVSGQEVARLQVHAELTVEQAKKHLEEQCGFPVLAQQFTCSNSAIIGDNSRLASLPHPRWLTLVLQPFDQKRALDLAVMLGHSAAVSVLLSWGPGAEGEEHRALLTSKDLLGETPLHTAASRGHESVCRALLQAAHNDQERDAMLVATDRKDRTPLCRALRAGKPAAAEVIVRGSGELKAVLHDAVQRGQVSIVRELLTFVSSPAERQVMLSASDRDGRNPFLVALERQNLGMALTLLDVSHPEDRKAMLAAAAASGKNILQARDDKQWTLLHHAASTAPTVRRTKKVTVYDLLAHAATREERSEILAARDRDGRTPYEAALKSCNLPVALALLDGSNAKDRMVMLASADRFNGMVVAALRKRTPVASRGIEWPPTFGARGIKDGRRPPYRDIISEYESIPAAIEAMIDIRRCVVS